jgi:serine/threonine protein kinase
VIAGRYALDREIGRGGSGVVWLGRDEVLGRQVALKRIGLLPGADSTDLARAEREARLSARLNHAHVVGVFDVVTDPESDARWLVMEYVDGLNLGQLVQMQGRLPADEAGPLLWQAADALVAAQAAGIVHRDVKPSNILVDRSGRVKLTDFGIARISTDPALTQTGMVTGSPAYLAPEVATGGRGDEAADVWSLGATAFHVLAGRPPYEVGDHVLGALYRIVNEEPPRLDDAGWMAPLLEGTMVRDPARRWTMEQVRDFLGDPSHPVPDTGHGTQTLETIAAAPTPAATAPPSEAASAPSPVPAPASAGPRGRRPSRTLLLLGLALVLLLAAAVASYVVLAGDDPSAKKAPASEKPTPTKATPTRTTEAPAEPTAEGIDSFIRGYVDAVSTDPAKSWQMLTPKFQQESGGFDKYSAFWEPATNGRVTSISPDPDNLTVSYQVHFDNFDNGPGPTVLDLTFEDGRYLIDGERTQGFEPAG